MSSARVKRIGRQLILVGGILSLGLIAIYWYQAIQRNEPLDQVGRKVLEAAKNGHEGVVWKYLPVEERNALQLDRDKLKRLLGWYVDCLDKFKPSGPVTFRKGQGGYLCEATQEYRNGENSATIMFAVYRTDDGPRCFVTRSLVFGGLHAKYAPLHPDKSPVIQTWSALRDGILQERRDLESLGLMGFVDSRYDAKVASWQRLQDYSSRAVVTLESRSKS